MKKIVPFKKEIDFKTNISEIISISLEHDYKIEESIVGEFIISGEYKMADTSTTTEKFFFNIPFDICLDEKYLLDKAIVDIDDFYYEIINDKTLVANIDILIQNLEEKPLIEERKQEIVEEEKSEEKLNNEIPIEIEPRCIEEEQEEVITPIINIEKIAQNVNPSNNIDNKPNVNIFNNLDDNETYSTYKIYIVRENDTLEEILMKYNIEKEELIKYNNIDEIKIGDKLIIPSNE